MTMDAAWKRSNKEYSKAGNRAGKPLKGEPTALESRKLWELRVARRWKQDIEYWVRMGFDRMRLEDEVCGMQGGASIGSLATRGK